MFFLSNTTTFTFNICITMSNSKIKVVGRLPKRNYFDFGSVMNILGSVGGSGTSSANDSLNKMQDTLNAVQSSPGTTTALIDKQNQELAENGEYQAVRPIDMDFGTGVKRDALFTMDSNMPDLVGGAFNMIDQKISAPKRSIGKTIGLRTYAAYGRPKRNNYFITGGNINSMVNGISGLVENAVNQSQLDVDPQALKEAVIAGQMNNASNMGYDQLESYLNGYSNMNHIGKKDLLHRSALGAIGNVMQSGFQGMQSGFKAGNGMALGGKKPKANKYLAGGIVGGIVGGVAGVISSAAAQWAASDKAKKEARAVNNIIDDTNEWNGRMIDLMQDNVAKQYADKLQNSWFKFGGKLGFSDFNNDMTYVNNGGTHEQNPYGGVFMGVDEEGTPNLLEEGEVIWNDNGNEYVFSKRLSPSKEFKKRHKLKKKDKSFADAAIAFSKESDERPFDKISDDTHNAIMSELRNEHELVRQLAAKDENNMFAKGGRKKKRNKAFSNPAYIDPGLVGEDYFYPYQEVYESSLDPELQGYVPPVKIVYPWQTNAPMLDYPFRNIYGTQVALPDQLISNPGIEEYIQNNGISVNTPTIIPTKDILNAASEEEVVNPVNYGFTIPSGYQSEGLRLAYDNRTKGISFPEAPDFNPYDEKGNIDFDKLHNPNSPYMQRLSYLRDNWNSDYVQNDFIPKYVKYINEYNKNKPNAKTITEDYVRKNPDKVFHHNTDGNFGGFYNGIIKMFNEVPDLKKAVEGKASIREKIPPITPMDRRPTFREHFITPEEAKAIELKPKDKMFYGVKEDGEDKDRFLNDISENLLPTVSSLMNIFDRDPDFAKQIDRTAARGIPSVSFSPIGDYIVPHIFDINTPTNMLLANNAATRRALGDDASAILASDYNLGNQLGQLYSTAEERNMQTALQAANFNRGTNVFNQEGAQKAQTANMQAALHDKNIRVNAANAAAGLRQNLRRLNDDDISHSLQAAQNRFDNSYLEGFRNNTIKYLADNGFLNVKTAGENGEKIPTIGYNADNDIFSAIYSSLNNPQRQYLRRERQYNRKAKREIRKKGLN